ncbi:MULTISPECIES: DUF4760 domain-containing protein [Pseudomonas]|uniref:DUF4760 domain-containing protein n=1 Tax=Pseudomonas TaxID=286 RepID=UPI00234CEAD0|nr:DUF4760 domain-containing protein [Pseudomonas sp. BLCC-B112]MDC7817492.1 DUF4760 domain-containing protein [Pseudomonas sp. BLCC-B112]
MLTTFANTNKIVLRTLYILGFILLAVPLSAAFWHLHMKEGQTLDNFNPSAYLMPLLAYLSIGLASVTIGITRKTASEKNALEFAKEWGALREHVQVLYMIRQQMLLPNRQLDRRKATAYMESLYDKTKASAAAGAAPEPKPGEDGKKADNAEEKAAEKPADKSADDSAKKSTADTTPSPDAIKKAAGDILNAMESCANAVRYGIYDEDFIYNIYGSHFIEFYELTYGLIKARQFHQARLWVNFEWLAVKWTLRRNITGVISKESVDTSYIINQSLKALKEHNKTRPCIRQLRKFEAKLERRKFPK